jgi:hypothetical protein
LKRAEEKRRALSLSAQGSPGASVRRFCRSWDALVRERCAGGRNPFLGR